jgi:hypothetical protein
MFHHVLFLCDVILLCVFINVVNFTPTQGFVLVFFSNFMDKFFNVLYDSHQIFNKFWNDSSYLEWTKQSIWIS